MEKIDSSSLRHINLRMHQVRALKTLFLSRDIMNTEALMLILNKKYKTTDGKRMLFKYLDMQEDFEVMDRKTRVLSYLNESAYSEIDDLIIPDAAVYVDSSLTGFAMPLIENHSNFGSIVHNPHVDFAEKKQLLEKLGSLIDRVHNTEDEHNMLFADLNEYNFIIDKDGNLKAIDLDSSFVDGLDITPSHMAYYLLKNKYISSLPEKYPTTDRGVIVPTLDSDLYCFCMIVLDALADEAMFKQDIGTYYEYLFYLKDLGVSEELLNVFERIYIPKNNLNPRGLLDAIPDDISEEAKFKVFQKKV